jgi:hypothetical protein
VSTIPSQVTGALGGGSGDSATKSTGDIGKKVGDTVGSLTGG